MPAVGSSVALRALRLLGCLLTGLACLAGFALTCLPAAADTIYYPRNENVDDPRGDYGYALLQLALQKAGSSHQAVMTPYQMQQNRAILELMTDTHRIDILATMTSAQREQQLLPVRIPMTKGLIGWRIALVRVDDRERLRRAGTLAALSKFETAQGQDWPDTQILRAAGITVHAVATYDSLFGLLKAGVIDWVPRSLNEIAAEAGRHPALAIEQHLVLHYPTADYFFVNRHNPALAEQVRRGLELALADGSFDQLLMKHYGALIRGAKLGQRRIIDIPNPLLSPETPLARKELWLTMDDFKRLKLVDSP